MAIVTPTIPIAECKEIEGKWNLTVDDEGGVTATRVFLKSLKCGKQAGFDQTLPTIRSPLGYPQPWIDGTSSSMLALPIPSGSPLFTTCILRSIDVGIAQDDPSCVQYTCKYETRKRNSDDDEEQKEADWQKSFTIGFTADTIDLSDWMFNSGSETGGASKIPWDDARNFFRNYIVWANPIRDRYSPNPAPLSNVSIWKGGGTNKGKIWAPVLTGTVTVIKHYRDFDDILERMANAAQSCNEATIFKMPPETVIYEGGNLDPVFDAQGNLRYKGTHNFSIKYIWKDAWGRTGANAVLDATNNIGGWNHYLRPDGCYDRRKLKTGTTEESATFEDYTAFPPQNLAKVLKLSNKESE
jgi:hypothetical protein